MKNFTSTSRFFIQSIFSIFLFSTVIAFGQASASVQYHEDEAKGNDTPGDAGIITVIDPVATLNGTSHNDQDVWYLKQSVFTDELVVKKVNGLISVKVYESDFADYSSAHVHHTVSSSFDVIALNPSKYYFILTLAGSPNPYEIQIGNSVSALPVELVGFTGELADNGIQLNWTTATEQENLGFEVQRSGDNKTWTTLGFVDGAGDSSTEQRYDFTDENPLKGNNYYRLRQVDFDGSDEYSDVIVVESRNTSNILINVFPNPTQDELNISLPSDNQSIVSGMVVDAQGRQIIAFEENNDGLVKIDVSSFISGNYFVVVYSNGETQTKAFYKK